MCEPVPGHNRACCIGRRYLRRTCERPCPCRPCSRTGSKYRDGALTGATRFIAHCDLCRCGKTEGILRSEADLVEPAHHKQQHGCIRNRRSNTQIDRLHPGRLLLSGPLILRHGRSLLRRGIASGSYVVEWRPASGAVSDARSGLDLSGYHLRFRSPTQGVNPEASASPEPMWCAVFGP